MTLLDGKKLSEKIKAQLLAQSRLLKTKNGRSPHLAAILVGDDPASIAYVNNKIKSCRQCDIGSALIKLDDFISEKELLEEIDRLNADKNTDGILVQLPLPGHIRQDVIASAILPEKDVDGFHPLNAGRLMLGQPCFEPATPKGIMMMLEHYQISLTGKHAVVIGRSNIVGRPLSIMLSAAGANATVTLCHSFTENLPHFTRQADILIAAIGRPAFVKADMIKPGAVVIDVGINRIESKHEERGYRLCGDVDFEKVAPLCSAITPVPGGVGPMTIIGLLSNTLKAAGLTEYDEHSKQ
jgi:methylenetetrahydrofolate dehydrogenase (NADP+)/methenyltetrahydrofolate cyclohydrolase